MPQGCDFVNKDVGVVGVNHKTAPVEVRETLDLKGLEDSP